MRRVLIAVVVVAVVAGCGGGRQSAPVDSSPVTTAAASRTPTVQAPATSQLAVYFVREGKVAPAIAFFLAKRICEELVAGEQAEKVRKAAEEQAKAAFGRS